MVDVEKELWTGLKGQYSFRRTLGSNRKIDGFYGKIIGLAWNRINFTDDQGGCFNDFLKCFMAHYDELLAMKIGDKQLE